MAKRLKRAFTIVELVIVIAVIAILAAVLIPTFTTLIDKANESNDIALVKNLNTALVSKEATDEVNTMQDALDAAYEYGYTVDKLTPSSSGDIVWDEVNNRFALINDGKVVFGDGDVSTGASLWRIAKNTEDLSDTYSNYLAGEWATVRAVSTGVDVGTNEGLDVTYTNTNSGAAQTVTFRTNGGTLKVEGPYDTVNHYGTAEEIAVTAVANNSYHEYGEVSRVSVASGHVEFMGGSSVKEVYVQANGCKVTVSEQVSNPADILIVTASGVTSVEVTKPATVEDVVAETSVATFDELEKAIAGEGKSYLKLTDNIVATKSLTVAEGKEVVLNANGKTMTAGEGFKERFFANKGTLTLKGNGTFDVSAAGANGYGTVNNFGTLTVEGGTYTNQKESNASNFYNRNGGTATFINPTIYGGGGCVATEVNTTTVINGGYYEDATYPAIENRGNMLITAGEFVNTSCSSCDNSKWGYTVRSGENSDTAYLKIQGAEEDSVKVTGVQGGLAVIGGSADIYNGVYKTVACKVHTSGASAYYAGYFTGESYKTSTTIYGGTFQSVSRTAIQIGNGKPAPDSGAGEESTVIIYNGTFIGGDKTKTAIYVETEKYAIGAAKISGGTFSSDPTEYVKEGHIAEENADGMFVVKQEI